MSKLDTSGAFQPVAVHAQQKELRLSCADVVFGKNGIEFLSSTPFPPYTEVTVDLRCASSAKRVCGKGVVVSCIGTRHAGYVVSLLFVALSRQSQARLNMLAQSRPA